MWETENAEALDMGMLNIIYISHKHSFVLMLYKFKFDEVRFLCFSRVHRGNDGYTQVQYYFRMCTILYVYVTSAVPISGSQSKLYSM